MRSGGRVTGISIDRVYTKQDREDAGANLSFEKDRLRESGRKGDQCLERAKKSIKISSILSKTGKEIYSS